MHLIKLDQFCRLQRTGDFSCDLTADTTVIQESNSFLFH